MDKDNEKSALEEAEQVLLYMSYRFISSSFSNFLEREQERQSHEATMEDKGKKKHTKRVARNARQKRYEKETLPIFKFVEEEYRRIRKASTALTKRQIYEKITITIKEKNKQKDWPKGVVPLKESNLSGTVYAKWILKQIDPYPKKDKSPEKLDNP